jgi:hypothetical protein
MRPERERPTVQAWPWSILGAVPVPDYRGQVVRVAGPPVDAAELPQLAVRWGEPIALLQAIRDIYTVPERQARWIRNASPAVTAAYTAAAARHGVLPYRDLPPVLRPGAGRTGHRLAGEGPPPSANSPCCSRADGAAAAGGQ